MKILVTGPINYNYIRSIVRSLQQLGHNVILIEMSEFYIQCTYLERKLYKLGAKFLEINHTERWNDNLINTCNKFQPNMVFVINGVLLKQDSLQKLRAQGISTILWMVDSIKRLQEHESKLVYYDNICVFEKDDVFYLKNKYNLNVHYYPVGFDETAYYPDETAKRDIDIAFVGTPTKNRLEILKHVADYAYNNSIILKIQGNWWDKKYFWKKIKFAQKHPVLSKYISNGLIDAMQIGELYRRSKICLNIHIPEHTGINPRTFEILATRSFELMDERQKTDDIIRPGTDLVMYKDVHDLINKIEYYLINEAKREEIATNGYEWVKTRFTIKQILENMLDMKPFNA